MRVALRGGPRAGRFRWRRSEAAGAANGVLKNTSTLSLSRESMLVINAFQLKSLILAQSERWRRG